MADRKKTIGITMRVVTDSRTGELRDALAHDWYTFLDWVLGDTVCWLPLPNLGTEKILKFAQEHQLEGVILSGGNDLGECPKRDDTETALIDYAIDNHFAVVGVCRGLQMLWLHLEGQLKTVESQQHVAVRHNIRITQTIDSLMTRGTEREVNSFHAYGLVTAELAQPVIPFAETYNGDIEGIIWPERRILGMMWHPEREQIFREMDKRIFRWAILGDDR